MALNPAALLGSGAPMGMPTPMSDPSQMAAPAPMGAAPAPAPGAGLDAMNSAALLALQGAQAPLPPSYKVDTQLDGSLLLKEVGQDGNEVVVKIISPPKRHGANANNKGA